MSKRPRLMVDLRAMPDLVAEANEDGRDVAVAGPLPASTQRLMDTLGVEVKQEGAGMDQVVHDGTEVVHVGTVEWLKTAAELLCFRPSGGDIGAKATSDDLLACCMEPGHDGQPEECMFGNASMLETIIAAKAGVRP